MSWDIVDVSDWPVLGYEQGGDEPKLWVSPPDTVHAASRSDWWLSEPTKIGRRGTGGGSSVPYQRTDDVSEVVASAVAGWIAMPSAQVALAVWKGATE